MFKTGNHPCRKGIRRDVISKTHYRSNASPNLLWVQWSTVAPPASWAGFFFPGKRPKIQLFDTGNPSFFRGLPGKIQVFSRVLVPETIIQFDYSCLTHPSQSTAHANSREFSRENPSFLRGLPGKTRGKKKHCSWGLIAMVSRLVGRNDPIYPISY